MPAGQGRGCALLGLDVAMQCCVAGKVNHHCPETGSGGPRPGPPPCPRPPALQGHYSGQSGQWRSLSQARCCTARGCHQRPAGGCRAAYRLLAGLCPEVSVQRAGGSGDSAAGGRGSSWCDLRPKHTAIQISHVGWLRHVSHLLCLLLALGHTPSTVLQRGQHHPCAEQRSSHLPIMLRMSGSRCACLGGTGSGGSAWGRLPGPEMVLVVKMAWYSRSAPCSRPESARRASAGSDADAGNRARTC